MANCGNKRKLKRGKIKKKQEKEAMEMKEWKRCKWCWCVDNSNGEIAAMKMFTVVNMMILVVMVSVIK